MVPSVTFVVRNPKKWLNNDKMLALQNQNLNNAELKVGLLGPQGTILKTR